MVGPGGPVGRRDFLSTSALLGISLAMWGCGSASNDSSFTGFGSGTPPQSSASVTGRVDLSQFGTTDLKVQSAFQGDAVVDSGGAFLSSVLTDATQLIFITDSQNRIRGLALSLPGQPLIVDATSTAMGLLFLTPGLLESEPQEAAKRIALLSASPAFQQLVDFLITRLQQTPLEDLATDAQFRALVQACLDFYLQSLQVSPKASPKVITDDANLLQAELFDPEAGKLEHKAVLGNGGWRFLTVIRQELDNVNTEYAGAPHELAKLVDPATLSFFSIPSLLSGATPISIGSMLRALEGPEILFIGSGTEILPLNHHPTTVTIRYWFYGPGSIRPTFVLDKLPPILEEEFGGAAFSTSVFAYILLPLMDILGAKFNKGKLW